jgi:RecB family exonuclease
MTLYRECPQKFKFRYVHKIPEKPKYYFAFGQSMHKALEFLYGVQKPPFPTLEQLLGFFDADWRATTFEEKGYASAIKELEGYDEGRRILVSYYQKHKENLFIPLSVEFKTTLDIDKLSLISIIDRIDYLGGGHVAIVDYKTGKTVEREPDQLYMYQKVMENSPVLKAIAAQKDGADKVTVDKLSFYHLPTLKVMEFPPAPEKEIDVFWAGVLKTADEIRSQIYTPAPEESKCRWCDYRNVCPVFTGVEFEQLQKTPKPEISQTPQSEEDILSQKIDDLGKTGQNYAALKKEIIALMQQKNYNTHYGKNFKIELNNKENIEFAEQAAVIDFLKEKNLLKKVLVPTQSSILALLDDAGVAEEDKKRLRALTRKTVARELQIKKVDS